MSKLGTWVCKSPMAKVENFRSFSLTHSSSTKSQTMLIGPKSLQLSLNLKFDFHKFEVSRFWTLNSKHNLFN